MRVIVLNAALMKLRCLDGINLATTLILEICGGNLSETKIIGQKVS